MYDGVPNKGSMVNLILYGSIPSTIVIPKVKFQGILIIYLPLVMYLPLDKSYLSS